MGNCIIKEPVDKGLRKITKINVLLEILVNEVAIC